MVFVCISTELLITVCIWPLCAVIVDSCVGVDVGLSIGIIINISFIIDVGLLATLLLL